MNYLKTFQSHTPILPIMQLKMTRSRFNKAISGEKMDSPEIERLIEKAVSNRPTVTNASLNLYVYNGRLVCGARAVMPKESIFVAHTPQDRLQNGFTERDWKLIVEKIKQVAETQQLVFNDDKNVSVSTAGNNLKEQQKTDQENFRERRREPRLHYRRSVWFGEDLNEELSQGQMVDVSSGGMAFTCYETCPHQDQELATRFSVPRFNADESLETVTFNRIARVCRVVKESSFLHRVAVQFAKPLPFKPGQQDIHEFNAKTKTSA